MIVPAELTVAIFALFVEYLIFSLLVIGFSVTLEDNLYDFPFFKVTVLTASLTLFVFTAVFCTFTLKLAFLPLFNVTVILAVPDFFAVTFPDLETVATFVLELLKLFTESPAPLVTFTVKVCFTFSGRVPLAFNAMLAFTLFP